MLKIEKYFDDHTMSVHLKENTLAQAKKGEPGAWKLEAVSQEIITSEQIQAMADEIVDACNHDNQSFVEIFRDSSSIVQYKKFRIVIVKPPVSDGWEITAVRPLVKLDIANYDIPETVKERIIERSSGIIIAGSVGSGKSTFASAVAEQYADIGRITKTIESPRDLLLSDRITQYSKTLGSDEEIHDILFLSRPDNVIFDEMRDTPDFKLYIDIRLGGSAMIGVLHAASPIDAVQRFISRMEVGMIPSVLDTIIFIDGGKIGQVLTLEMSVKVPSGMQEADLARPVIEVKDLAQNKLLYEIYSYGEQTVVIPVKKQGKSPAQSLAELTVRKEFKKYVDDCEVEFVGSHRVRVYVPRGAKRKIIGAQGANILNIEKRLGISIDIALLESRDRVEQKRVGYQVLERGKNLIFKIQQSSTMVDFCIDEDYLFTSTSSKKGEIKVNTRSEIGEVLIKAFENGKNVYIRA
jgi:ATPase